MRISRISSLLLLFLFAISLDVLYSAGLEGKVYDPSGKVVAGARVTLVRALVAIKEVQTDADGVYRFSDVEDGTYQITASARGLAGSAAGTEVKGETARQDIQLKLSAMTSQVVVSASLGAALLPEIGSSVSLISNDEIGDRGAQNVLEVIRGVPGVEVNQTGRRGGVTGVFIRGGDSSYNAVMVDGIPVNEFGGAFDMSSLPTDGIERVEITRGPQSALYGSNAVTGAINIVTQKGEGPPRFTALAEGGSYSTRRFATGGSGLTSGFSWAYNLSRMDSEGIVQNDDYRNQSAFLSLGYQGARRQFDFNFMGNANEAGAPGAYGSDPNDTFGRIDTISRGKQNLFGYRLGYTEQFTKRLRQVTAVNLATNDLYYRSAFEFMGDVFVSDYRSENLRGGFNTRSEIALASNDTLALGFEFNREQIRTDLITDSQGSSFLLPRASFAYFAENRWSPNDRFFLISGVRIDNIRTGRIPENPFSFSPRPFIPANSVVKVNPRISASYIINDDDTANAFGATRIHGSFGTGIRPPDGFELTSTDNPDLKPERSLSFDLGLEQRFFSSRALVDVTYFYNRFEDQIVTVGGAEGRLSNYRSANLDNSRAQGIEITFRLRPIPSLELGGEYTYLNTSILALDGTSVATAPFEVGQQLLRRPRHSAGYNVTWRYRRLTLNTNAYIRGKTLDVDPSWGTSTCGIPGMQCFFDNPGHTRVDAGFSYRLPYGMEMYGRVYNLLNKSYEESFGFPALGANFMAGMKFAIPAE